MLQSMRMAGAAKRKSTAPLIPMSATPHLDAMLKDRDAIARTKAVVEMRCWQVTANDWRVQRMPRWTLYYRRRPRRAPRTPKRRHRLARAERV